MSNLTQETSDARRLVEAAAWRSHLTEAGLETSEAFEAWLAADEGNRQAWRQVQGPWEFFGEHAAAPELLELRRAALADARGAGRERWSGSWATARARVAIAASLLAVTVTGLAIWWTQQPDVYRTALGERRVVTLTDGSQVVLDSQSEVRVRYTEYARDLTLSKGQARFDVAHDVERPFSVAADGHKVIATGTAFNVDLLGSSLLVTLIEGHVVVLPEKPAIAEPEQSQASGTEPRHASGMPDREEGGRTAKAINLVAGEQLVAAPRALATVQHVDVEHATAWLSGQLVFENEPLSSVVARVNRYAAHPIVLKDAETAELKISGVFHAGDVNGFIATVTDYLPVGANRGEDGSVRLSRR